MIRKFTAVLVAALLSGAMLAFPVFAESDSEHDITTGSPWLASSVEGTIVDGTIASLKDDFYLYTNMEKINAEKILPGYAAAGVINNRAIQNNLDILSLFSGTGKADSADAQLALDLYGKIMDWEKRERLGVKPLQKAVERLEAVSDIEGLTDYYMTTPFEELTSDLFSIGVFTDFEDSTRYVPILASSSLLLSDAAEYSKLTEAGKLKKEVYSELILYLLGRLGYSKEESEQKLANTFELETKLAPSMLTTDDKHAPDYLIRVNNHFTYDELVSAQKNLPVVSLFSNYGIDKPENTLVLEPEWLKALSGLYNNDNITLLKDYLIVNTVINYATNLDRDCFEHILSADNALTGTTGRLSDEQYAAGITKSLLPWQVTKLYCEKFVTEQDKKNINEISEKVIAGYSRMLSENTFLTEATRKKAQEKLRTIKVRSLYPDDWTPYSYEGLILPGGEDDSLVDCLFAIKAFTRAKELEKFGKPVDKSLWSDAATPITVNCFYYPLDNSINMLAAFCQGEIYNGNMKIEEMYAKIGTIIGHEISHAFDGSGSNFDKEGNLHNWWTDEDRALFNAKIQKIADYASTVTYWDDVYFNGAIMTGEICADMGGVAVMLRMAKDVPGFDYGLFFRSYAELWESIMTYNAMLSLMSNEHPADYFRVNTTLQQFDEFLDFYGIREGDGMYLAPEDRVAIW